jgi:hypothetical protein
MATKRKSASKSSSVLKSLYSGSATIGKGYVLLSVLVLTALLIYAIVFVNQSSTYTTKDEQGNQVEKPVDTDTKIWTTVICVVIMLISWVWLYATFKVKAFAAFQGVDAIF